MERRTPLAGSDPAPLAASVAVGLTALALYVSGMPAVAGLGDSSELTLVLATGGLAHPTGYVPWTLAGHAFVSALRALGLDATWAANAWSALGGAVALGLLHRLVTRLLERAGVRGPVAAAVASLPVVALGAGAAWSEPMMVAEVTSWHLAWVAGAVLCAWSVCDRAAAGRDAAWITRAALGWGLLVGVGAAHHLSSVLVSLPLTVALVMVARPSLAASLGALALALMPPIGALAWVMHRAAHPAAFGWQATAPHLAAAWAHLSGAGYAGLLGRFAPGPEQRALLATNVYPWLALALAAALAWPFVPGATPRAFRWAMLAAAVLPTVHAFGYGVPDPSSYFLPALAIGLALVPVTLAATPARRAGLPLALAAAVGLAAFAWRGAGIAATRRAECEQVERLARERWRAIGFARGFVVWDADLCWRFDMYRLLDREWPERVVVSPLGLLDDTARARFARRHGFDPLALVRVPGPDEPWDAETERRLAIGIAMSIDRQTPWPVVFVEPGDLSVHRLTKR